MPQAETIEIPNRSLFRQPEVCEIAHIQPYVLRSWEAEFPDLGVAKTQGGPRVYRRADVERVLRLKHLLFVEGLTLAGARRKLLEEQPAADADAPALTSIEELLGSDARERIQHVERTLRELAMMLARQPGSSSDVDGFQLRSIEVKKPAARPAKPATKARPTKGAKVVKVVKRKK
jgi:DNA-binding transcriptional MerR regulator